MIVIANAGVLKSKMLHVRSDTTYKFSKSVGVYKMNVPIVERISPAVGPTSGRIILTLHGRRFQGVESVRIAGVECDLTHLRVEDNGTRITATLGAMSEAHRTGGITAGDVIVKTKEGGFGVSRVKFYYYASNDLREQAEAKAAADKKRRIAAERKAEENKKIGADEKESGTQTTSSRANDKTYVRVRANIATLMDQDGFIADTNFIPDDRFDHTGKVLQQLFEQNLRLHGTLPDSVSVDDVAKFHNK